MSNLLSLTLTNGVPSGSGTVSTIDNLILTGAPVTSLPAGANQIGNVSITSMPATVIGAGLPSGANTIGAVTVTSGAVSVSALPVGANQIGNVSITTMPTITIGGLSTGANTIGSVAGIVNGLPAGANQIGNVSITAMPSITLGALSTGANQIGNVSITAHPPVIVGQGLPTGANVIGAVTISGNPSLGVSTAFIGSINAISSGLPTGANTIGAVTIGLGSVQIGNVSITAQPGLSTGANTIGAVSITGTPTVSITGNLAAITGNVAGITANVVLGPSTNLVGNVNVSALPALAVGGNQIGNVSITAHPGIATGANTIGSVNLTGTGNVAGVTANVVIGAGTNLIGNVGGSIIISSLPNVTLAAANNKVGIVQIGNSTGGVIDTFGGASTAILAGANTIGAVLSNGSYLTNTLTVNNTATYVAGWVVGGPLSFPNALSSTANNGVLQNITLRFANTAQLGEFDLVLISNATALVGTYGDHAAPAFSTADVPLVLGVFPMNAPIYPLAANMTIYTSSGIGASFVGTPSRNLTGILIAKNAPTNQFTSTSEVSLSIGTVW